MMKTDRLGIIRQNLSTKTISFMEIGREILQDTPTVQTVVKAHSSLNTGLKVVGFGLLGLFAVRQFIK